MAGQGFKDVFAVFTLKRGKHSDLSQKLKALGGGSRDQT